MWGYNTLQGKRTRNRKIRDGQVKWTSAHDRSPVNAIRAATENPIPFLTHQLEEGSLLVKMLHLKVLHLLLEEQSLRYNHILHATRAARVCAGRLVGKMFHGS